MKVWLTVGEAAQYARVNCATIYTACERSGVRQVRVGGRRTIRLKPEWIDAWLERHVLDAKDRRMVGRTRLGVDVPTEATS